ncbi:multidrug resistance-associated ABC transporter [Salix suchowensis]|nr:multidrug resistance-associated ABC transporter [Salix suchowensis]
MTALITTGVDAGLVGLVLSYAVNTTSSLVYDIATFLRSVSLTFYQNWVVRSASEVEQNIVSVERMVHYIELPSEGAMEIPETKPTETWPPEGELLLALFRIIEPTEGTILIDGIDITKIGLHDLRSAIAIVPQSPDLFEGTLRDNIDPLNEYTDADIWQALTQSHLREYAEAQSEKLDARKGRRFVAIIRSKTVAVLRSCPPP